MMTASQRRVLLFIDSEIARTGGVSPTYREIARYFGMASTTQVFNIVNCLIERGHLVRIPNRARAFALIRHLRQEWWRFDDVTKTLVRLAPVTLTMAGP